MAISFASGALRRTWQGVALHTLLWIIVAIGIGHLFASGESPWLIAALAYAAFIALSVLYWVSGAIVQWIVWRVIWRKAAVNDLVAAFEAAHLPEPPPHLYSPDAWFEELANHADLPMEQRFSALAHFLRIKEFAPGRGVLATLRTRLLYEEAISAYRTSVVGYKSGGSAVASAHQGTISRG